MNWRLIISTFLVFALLSAFEADAQIQRRGESKKSVPSSTQNKPRKESKVKDTPSENELYIIAIEDGTVYIDKPKSDVTKGSVFDVVATGKTIEHPVTGKIIEFESEPEAKLQVVGIYNDYLECKCQPAFAEQRIQPGMKVRISSEQIPVAKESPNHDHSNKTLDKDVERAVEEKLLKEVIEYINSNSAPVKGAAAYVESVVANENRLVVTKVVSSGFLFGEIEKSIKKGTFNELNKGSLKIDAMNMLADKLGYEIMYIFYDKKKKKRLASVLNDSNL